MFMEVHSMDDRRRAQRFPLDLPLEVKWKELAGDHQEAATIRDISASGIYFLVDHDMKPDSKVEFYVKLQVEGAPGGGVLLHCIGSVVRVDPKEDDPEHLGVAARIDRYRFLRPGQSPEEVSPDEE